MPQSIRHIIQKVKSEGTDQSLRNQFLSLFHQPDKEFELKQHLLEELFNSPEDTSVKSNVDEQFEKFWQNRPLEIIQSPKKYQYIVQLSKWAAVLVFGLFIGYFFNSRVKNHDQVFYTSIAPKGSISEVILPEGTHICLNSGSTLKYSAGDSLGKREIYLTGEAWFQVSKMKSRPFLVHTLSYDVEVTGTTFNVKAYPEDNEIATTLVEGSVRIQSSENIKLDSTTILKQGEQLVFNKALNTTRVNHVNTKMFTSWKENKLVFINMTLKDLKTLLERKYGVEIRITDQSIMDYHYDGTIKNETIIEVLEILKFSLPIEYEIEGQNIIIRQKRRN